MRLAPFLAVPLMLAACEGRDVTAICASQGDVNGVIRTAFHDADGARMVERYDAATGTVTTLEDVLAEPPLADLWRLAETTMRALPEVEPSACNLDVQAYVTVVFSDGTRIARTTTCQGNALDRVATEVLAASELDRLGQAEADPGADPGRNGIAVACEALP